MEIITGNGERDLAGKIKEEVEKIDRSRNEVKRQWLVNVMFLYGKHHFMVSKRYGTGEEMLSQRIAWEIESLRKANTVRRTSNYILPLFRSLYSRLIRMKANVHAEPTTSTDRDRDAARVSKEVLEDFWQNCNRNNPWLAENLSGMQAVLMKLVLYKLTLGNAYLIPYFNPKANTFVYDQLRKDIIPADVGEAEVRVASVLDVFRDQFGRHVIERRFLVALSLFQRVREVLRKIHRDAFFRFRRFHRQLFLGGDGDGGLLDAGVLLRLQSFGLPSGDFREFVSVRLFIVRHRGERGLARGGNRGIFAFE